MEKPLIRNAIQTPDGTILESKFRHDYQEYTDKNGKTYMVDGGLDYLRRSIVGDEKDLSLYNNEPHEVQREVLTWGTRGINGNLSLKYVKISEMETSHINAVLLEYHPMDIIEACMEQELKNREEK
ncbi:MAG TPA: hypothetical protein ENI61_01075 [Ignavibacteria bacterium]|nr:hypothetical protein [Ignavibacteria bacterium]